MESVATGAYEWFLFRLQNSSDLLTIITLSSLSRSPTFFKLTNFWINYCDKSEKRRKKSLREFSRNCHVRPWDDATAQRSLHHISMSKTKNFFCSFHRLSRAPRYSPLRIGLKQMKKSPINATKFNFYSSPDRWRALPRDFGHNFELNLVNLNPFDGLAKKKSLIFPSHLHCSSHTLTTFFFRSHLTLFDFGFSTQYWWFRDLNCFASHCRRAPDSDE